MAGLFLPRFGCNLMGNDFSTKKKFMGDVIMGPKHEPHKKLMEVFAARSC
jgi:hypothetical protein